MSGDLGDSLDLPYEGQDPTWLDLDAAMLSGGVVVMGAVVPVPDVGPKPGIVFRFARPDGEFWPPVVLIVDPRQAQKLTPLVRAAVETAILAARSQGADG